MNTLQQAQFWQKLGIATIPIRYKDKRPELKSWQEFQKRLPTNTELSKWFSGPFHNLGVVVGWQNLAVIDFDSDTEYARWQLWIARRPVYRWIRQTLQVKTARGVHVYVTTAQPAQNAKLPGIDIKAVGGYVLYRQVCIQAAFNTQCFLVHYLFVLRLCQTFSRPNY